LKPVKAQFVFAQLAKKVSGALVSFGASFIDIWHGFEYNELTINMRHSEDKEWADLNTNARIGIVTEENDQLLRSRVIQRQSQDETNAQMACRKYEELKSAGDPPLIICPLRDQCDEINELLLERLKEDTVTYKATDSNKTNCKNIKDSDAGGLASTIVSLINLMYITFMQIYQEVAKGARVMLVRNLYKTGGVKGLVNGAVGYVTGFDNSAFNKTVSP
jgi:hypothetical protein